MPLTAEEVIRSARDRHPAFSRESTPDPLVRRYLADVQKVLMARIADLKPDAVHVDDVIELPAEDFAAGHSLPLHLRVHGARAVAPDGSEHPVEIVGYARRQFARSPAAYIREGVLYLLGTPAEWTHYSSVVVDLFPEPDELATNGTHFNLPGQASPCLTAAAADFMAARVVPPLPNRSDFSAAAFVAQEAYLDEVTERRRPKVVVATLDW